MEPVGPANIREAAKSASRRGLQVDVHGRPRDIAGLWRAFQRSAAGGPHQTYDWVHLWLAHHPARHALTPNIATVRDRNGQCVAILPLAVRRHLGCTILEWLGADQGNYSSGLFDAEFWSRPGAPDAGALLATVLDRLPPVDIVHLADHPADLNGLPNPLAGLPGIESASAGYAMELGKDWGHDYEKRVSASYRRSLRRNERRLCKHGPLRFERIDEPSERLSTLETIIEQKSRWLAERGIDDFLGDEEMRAFYGALLALPIGRTGPAVRLYRLRAGGEIVAASIDLIFQNRFYGLLASTTTGPLQRFGPGKLLLKLTVEDLAKDGITRLDFGAGEEENKLRWCTIRRERRHNIVPVTTRGYAYAGGLGAGLLAKTQIKRSPQLWRLVRQARQYKRSAVSLLPWLAAGGGACALIDA